MRYPHFSLGQQPGFIGLNLQFHQLSYEQFVAGELATILSTRNKREREGRIDLLQRISLQRLRSGVSWVQVRNTYTHIIRRIENCEIDWQADWDRYERNIYDKVVISTAKQEKPKGTANKNTVDTGSVAIIKSQRDAKKSPPSGKGG